MAKFQSPLLGYNNNVRHKNRQFHIQTEDSGVNHPHIITHLFMDGGRILKSVKKSYAEHVGADGMSEIVRVLMKEQHKAIFIALRDGQFDHLVDAGSAPDVPAVRAPQKLAEAPSAAAAQRRTSSRPPRAQSEAPMAMKPVEALAPLPSGREFVHVPSAPRLELALPDMDADDAPATTRQAEPPDGVRELTLDFDALESASNEAPAAASSLFRASDLPPPAKNVFGKEPGTAGAYRTVEAEPSRRLPSSRPAARSTGDARYAPARPAAIFAATQRPIPQSLFNDDLVSDKSLDEVILSYLAEDLEPPRRK